MKGAKMKNAFKKSLTQDRGMSLIEVILFLVVLGVTLLPLTRLSVINSRSLARYAKITTAVYDAQRLAERVWADYNVANGYTNVRNKWNTSGVLTPNNNTYTVQVSPPLTWNNIEYVVVTISVTPSGISSDPVQISFWLPEK